MAEKVIMPKLEMAQETGKIVEWLKEEGEEVAKGEPLLVIETDKVTVEIEATASGLLAGVRAAPGEEVPISTTIAYLLAPGEDLPEDEAVEPGPALPEAAVKPPAASPVARRLAAEHAVDLSRVSGSGPKGQITKEDVEAALPTQKELPAKPGRVRATPAARRLARARGIELSRVQGSGPRGRIHAEDILDGAPLRPGGKPQAGQVIPLEGMRQTIAERMTMSYTSAPHITLTVRVDMGGLEETRTRINKEAEREDRSRVSVTPFIVSALAWALRRHPWLNSSLTGEEIHLRSEINIGVAVALEEGLIVPVVHDADRKGLAQISEEIEDLARRARSGDLTPSDVAGGTFTLSNLGPFGVDEFTAIINPPQAAILAVGAMQPEVVADAEGRVVVRPMARMTLSADHRVVDGAVAAQFLADVRDAIEKPWLLQW